MGVWRGRVGESGMEDRFRAARRSDIGLAQADTPTRRDADTFPPRSSCVLARSGDPWERVSSKERLQARELICDLQSWFDSLDWRAFEKEPGRLTLGNR